jgi:hypothetical protein
MTLSREGPQLSLASGIVPDFRLTRTSAAQVYQAPDSAPADYSGGTVADFHGLPRSPCQLNCFHAECKVRSMRCQMQRSELQGFLAVLPLRRALFHQRPQAFL